MKDLHSDNDVDTSDVGASDDQEPASHPPPSQRGFALNHGVHPDEDEDGHDEMDSDEDEDDDDEMDFDENEDEESLFMSSDEFDEFEWLESIHARAIIPSTEKEEAVATCHENLIRRDKIIDNFYDDMEEPSEWTCELATDLFDHYGSLRPEFIDHPFRKGSGIWAMSFLMEVHCSSKISTLETLTDVRT